ncbi:Sodium/potassium/calcium exchanger 3 [Acipenser ruthenus]|uniref:Sodium/potassium/calcium exchanger 3 n=1 Tax=Acipenser ruthenus TaxID=7906 RepID=A0A444U5N2_ACIRT|nr:Sodium/potassium/calcium exchanger 3 [Acipenser ruthenus]
MAAGSSAPELFTSVIGVFITKGDVGVGTIVGSAVFNILCIIGVCGIFAGQVMSVVTQILTFLFVLRCDNRKSIKGWESLVLVLMYLVYIVIMKFNYRALRYFDRRKKSTINMTNGMANNTEIDDNSNCEATVVLLKKANFHHKASVLMVDELLSAYPHQLSFSDAGLRIMITSHFPPRTRLTMASRMLITERQRLINNKSFTNGDSEVAIRTSNKHRIENGLVASSERGMNGHHGEEDGIEAGNETENENEDNENNENDEEEEDDDDNQGPLVPFELPVIGYTLGIPDVIMGITFLAAGTSVPDCMASLIVARQGMGDMAVSNSIGSNVFDILIGLGLPWALQTLVIDYGSYVVAVHLNKWKLDKKLGCGCLLLYAIFLCFSILIEFNVFTFVNLPMCREL